MSRRLKIAIAASAVVVVVLILTRTSFHLTRENQATSSSFTFVNGSAESNSWRTYGKIAIVSTRPEWHERALQAKLVDKIKDRLSNCGIAYEVNGRDSGLTGRSPQVILCDSEEQAARQGAELIVNVDVRGWHYSPIPFLYRTYDADIRVEGTRPLKLRGNMDGDGLLAYQFSADVRDQGSMLGLFSSAYLTSNLADSVAEDVVGYVEKQVSDKAGDQLSRSHEQDRNTAGHAQPACPASPDSRGSL